MRLIELSFPAARTDRVLSVLESSCEGSWTVSTPEEGRTEIRMVIAKGGFQEAADKLQSVLASDKEWRIVVLPVEAALQPSGVVKDETKAAVDSTLALREEVYQDVSSGALLNRDFLVLTILSAIVASFGLNADNMAVVIGAMVIAPLLGPLLAFSFASALGDWKLMLTSGRTAIVGLLVGFATAVALGALIDVNLDSKELTDRTVVGLDSIALALASGGAAALSIVTGLSSALVGVMVAVALLPPSVAIALFLSAGEIGLATNAGLLLATNVVSVNIASQMVFYFKGVRPRTWRETKSATKSRRINLLVWGTLLLALAILIGVGFNQP